MTEQKSSMFEKATKTSRRLKMYIYGETGTGKTVTALGFPSPAVIDTERGTDHYGKFFDFDVNMTSSIVEINGILDVLLKDSMGYKTLVIDPFSNVWDRMQQDLERYLRKKKGDPNYQLTGLDYRPLKTQIKMFVSKLNDLDMNIILTARSKAVYSADAGEFMKQIGTGPEGPNYLPNMFDVVMEIKMDSEGKRTAHVIKDRTNTLERNFEFSYKTLTDQFGIEDLERDPLAFEKEHKNRSGRNVEIILKKKKVMTAGITQEQILGIEALIKGTDLEKDIVEKLQLDYGVSSFLDLREDEASLLITDLTNSK